MAHLLQILCESYCRYTDEYVHFNVLRPLGSHLCLDAALAADDAALATRISPLGSLRRLRF